MSGMLEKIARAIVHARHLFYNGETGSDFAWHSVGPEVQECALQEARAALLSMREADHKMLESVKPWSSHWGPIGEAREAQKAAYYADQATVASQHRDMIDAILSDGQ